MRKKTESNPNSVENSYLFWQSAVWLARKPSCVQVTLLANISKEHIQDSSVPFCGKESPFSNLGPHRWMNSIPSCFAATTSVPMPLQSLPSMIGHLRWQCDSTFSTRGGFLMPVFYLQGCLPHASRTFCGNAASQLKKQLEESWLRGEA